MNQTAYQPKILAFNGSLRAQSWNYQLVKVVGNGAEQAGAEVTYLHLNEIPMPLYDQDLEQRSGIPENGRRFKELLIAHDGLLISSPEYNSSISAALKNAIDWASRSEGDEVPLACFSGKTAAIVSASPGGLGGLRGLVHLRAILGNLGVTVLPQQHALGQAHSQFNPDGSVTDEQLQQKLFGIGKNLADTCRKLYS